MASGVTVDDAVLTIFNDMKLKRPVDVDGKKKKLKAVIFCMSDDNKKIVVEEGQQIYDDDVDSFKTLKDRLPKKSCRYCLFDFTYTTKESKKEEMAFFTWAPDCCSIKDKMLYASSQDAIKKKFSGLKHGWQFNDSADMECECVAEKFGSDVISLEGHTICGHP
ncbi:cofilin-2 [Thalassophryne amazonica]|uniref:cofilin-2 n=1 Tax=Thalassophryne amazonica TaxID=390379 RepID=UPI0014709175|nr:cofilin-2 [Thalassophryne amazonica]